MQQAMPRVDRISLSRKLSGHPSELSLGFEAIPGLLQVAGSAVVGFLQAALRVHQLLVDPGPQRLCLVPLDLACGLAPPCELCPLSLLQEQSASSST